MQKIFDFDINVNKEVIRPSGDNLNHEAPVWQMPNWRTLQEAYKNAAKGISEQLAKRKVGRLCSYLNIYARPSRESVVLYHSDKNKKLRDALNPEESIAEKDFYINLTGVFIDMPDGRWHYVELPQILKLNTAKIWKKYNPLSDIYPDVHVGFKYGFVREDWLKMGEEATKYKKITYNTALGLVHPTYYNYSYKYYEHPENGYSYLYMLMPRLSDSLDLIYPYTVNRVTAYRNEGDTTFLEKELAEPAEEKKKSNILMYAALTTAAIYLGKKL